MGRGLAYIGQGIAEGVGDYARNKLYMEDRTRKQGFEDEDRAYTRVQRGRETEQYGIKTQEQARERDALSAHRQFWITKDPQPMLDVMNKYEGSQLQIQPAEGGYMIGGTRPDGSPMPATKVSPDDLEGGFLSWFDPKGATKLALEQRSKMKTLGAQHGYDVKLAREKGAIEASQPKTVSQGSALVQDRKEIYKNPNPAGENVTKYNPQGALRDVKDVLMTALGGKLDAFGKWSLPEGNSERAIKLLAIAQNIEQAATRAEPGKYTPGAIVDYVLSKNLSPQEYEEIKKRARQEAMGLNPVGPDFLRPGAVKEAYGGLSQEEWTKNRSQEMLRERTGGGLSGFGQPGAAPQPGIGLAVPPQQPVQSAPQGPTQPAVQTQVQQPAQQQPATPDPVQHSGRIIRDTATGKRYQSNGRQWVEIP